MTTPSRFDTDRQIVEELVRIRKHVGFIAGVVGVMVGLGIIAVIGYIANAGCSGPYC